jgi:hypothetical protein
MTEESGVIIYNAEKVREYLAYVEALTLKHKGIKCSAVVCGRCEDGPEERFIYRLEPKPGEKTEKENEYLYKARWAAHDASPRKQKEREENWEALTEKIRKNYDNT